MRDFRDKVAVVTGAAGGIGLALARRFAAEGMALVLADVEEPALAAAEADLRAGGATVMAVRTDVAQASEVEALARRVLETHGAVHVLCNNAGVGAGGPFWEMTDADWRWVVGVNLWGVIHGCRIFLPHMMAGGGEAHIVNVASMAGLVSGPFMSIYNTTKHAVVGLSESLHQDLLSAGARVRVSVVCPGWVDTRIAEAERNRPAALANPAAPQTPEREALMAMFRQVLAVGLPPARVADLVVDAIRAERLYVLTHPDWKPLVRRRMDDLLEDRIPALAVLL